MRSKKNIPHRDLRVADQIKRDLAELIARDLKDPRVGMVTLNEVEVTPDFAYAKIYFSVLGSDPALAEETLNRAGGRLRSALFKRLSIHTIPTLRFVFDATTEQAVAMDALIARAVASHRESDEGQGL